MRLEPPDAGAQQQRLGDAGFGVVQFLSGAFERFAAMGVAQPPDLRTHRAFVLAQYFGYLRRNPNEGADADFSGYRFWLSKLEQFGGDYVAAEMVRAFLDSAEYRRRFGR